MMPRGRRKTTIFFLVRESAAKLDALAHRSRAGELAALEAEFDTRDARFAAAEAFFEKYEVPPLEDEALARLEREWRNQL